MLVPNIFKLFTRADLKKTKATTLILGQILGLKRVNENIKRPNANNLCRNFENNQN